MAAATTTIDAWKHLDQLWTTQQRTVEQRIQYENERKVRAPERSLEQNMFMDGIHYMVPMIESMIRGPVSRVMRQPHIVNGQRNLVMEISGDDIRSLLQQNPLLFQDPLLQQQQQQQPLFDPIHNHNNMFQNLLHQTLLAHQPHVEGNGGRQLTALPSTHQFPVDTVCPICLCAPTESADPWTQVPCCRNYLHMNCAQTHLKNDKRCPMCRAAVP